MRPKDGKLGLRDAATESFLGEHVLVAKSIPQKLVRI